jgi:hypothetical protein
MWESRSTSLRIIDGPQGTLSVSSQVTCSASSGGNGNPDGSLALLVTQVRLEGSIGVLGGQSYRTRRVSSDGMMLMVVKDCSPVVGSHCSMRQSSGQLSSRSRFPSSQVSGAVTIELPQMVHDVVQPSFGSVSPSSHSSPASSLPFPQTGVGVVVVVVEVVVVVVDVVVVGGAVVVVVVVGGTVVVLVVVVVVVGAVAVVVVVVDVVVVGGAVVDVVVAVVLVVVVVGAVVVVDAVVLVMVVLLVVVVVVPAFSRAATAVATHSSTSASTVAAFPSGGRQSLRDLLSSFAKQPFSGSSPPSNFAITLSTQPCPCPSATRSRVFRRPSPHRVTPCVANSDLTGITWLSSSDLANLPTQRTRVLMGLSPSTSLPVRA